MEDRHEDLLAPSTGCVSRPDGRQIPDDPCRHATYAVQNPEAGRQPDRIVDDPCRSAIKIVHKRMPGPIDGVQDA